MSKPRILAVVDPFDSFGSAGTGAGAVLLGDLVRELIHDADQEMNSDDPRPNRSSAYHRGIRVVERQYDSFRDYRKWREAANAWAAKALERYPFVFWLGGNHLSVLPIYDQLQSGDLVILIDAHLDLYAFADCTAELSHGNFLRFVDGKSPGIVAVGDRDLLHPSETVGSHVDAHIGMEAWLADPDGALAPLRAAISKAKRVWVDLDCDALDPSFFPAVSHPVPFGMTPQQLLTILLQIPLQKWVGMSISEFDPGRDENHRSLELLGWLIEWVVLRHSER